MYQAFYRLRQMPFDAVADPALLVETAGRQGALDAIADQVRRRTGVITLEGWPGAGKTELLRAYERSADPDRVRVGWITRPDFDRPALVALIADMLASGFATPEPGQDLKRQLAARAAAGQATVLLVDDTETLSDGALRALGSIADMAGEEDSLVSIILVVRPPFVALFSRAAAAALDRRASVRIRLPPLTPAEARGLILHRLRQAGTDDPATVLSPEAVEAIVVASGGIPRRLLSLGDRVMQAGAARRRLPIDYATAEAAIRDCAPTAAAVPARVRPPPISIEPRYVALQPSAFSRAVDGISKVAVPAMLLIVAAGVGYWLWALSDDTARPPTPTMAAALPPPRAPAASPPPPPASPPSPTTAPPATAPPSASTAAVTPAPPVAPAPPRAAAAPVAAPAPVNLLFISARRGDTLRKLYRSAYRTPRYRPPFDQMLAANPGLAADHRLAGGELVALPGPLLDR